MILKTFSSKIKVHCTSCLMWETKLTSYFDPRQLHQNVLLGSFRVTKRDKVALDKIGWDKVKFCKMVIREQLGQEQL